MGEDVHPPSWGRRTGVGIFHLRRSPQNTTLGKDVDFDFIYVVPKVSMGHHMAIAGMAGYATQKRVTKAWWHKEPWE